MSTPDAQLAHIRHTFDSAFRRMRAAATEADLKSEMSNLLGQLYSLGELCKTRLGADPFYKLLLTSDHLRAARAAMWARNFDAHRVVPVASIGNVYTRYYTNMYGVLVWKPLTSLPKQTDESGRHLDYRNFLENRAVLGTTRRAFDAMAALVVASPAGDTEAPGAS